MQTHHPTSRHTIHSININAYEKITGTEDFADATQLNSTRVRRNGTNN